MNIGGKQYAYVYFAVPRGNVKVRRVKIGISTNLPLRLQTLQLRLVCAVRFEAAIAKKVEIALHQDLAHLREPQSNSTEWFSIDPSLRLLIRYMRAKKRWPWDKTLEVVV